MCKSDDCIRLYFCIRFEFSLIFTDGFLISGGMGKCHNCKNSLKCVGFMCKNDNCILCRFVLDSIFPGFVLIFFRFWTDRNQVIITRSSLECIGFMCKSTILATWLFVLQLVLAAIITDGSRPTAQTSRSADPAPVASPGAQPASQPESRVETGWKPGGNRVETGYTEMRMSDP